MPVILKKEDEQNWIQGENYKNFTHPYSHELVATSLENNAGQLGLFNLSQ